jgi:mono/diheme cytochrome c family protein
MKAMHDELPSNWIMRHKKRKDRPMKQPRNCLDLNRIAGGAGALSALLLVAWMMPAQAQAPAGRDLRLFYSQQCAGCHGVDGAAQNAAGKKLKGQNLTDPVWRKGTSDEAMVKVIQKGIFFGLAMPGYKKELTLSESQRLVAEVIRQSEKGKVIGKD